MFRKSEQEYQKQHKEKLQNLLIFAEGNVEGCKNLATKKQMVRVFLYKNPNRNFINSFFTQ